VFAGEDVECTITFKNVALPEGRGRSPARAQNGFAPGGERQRKLPPVHSSTRPSVSRNSSFASQIPPPPPHGRGHRPTLSLSTPAAGERRSPAPQSASFGNNTGGQSHGRSLSIMSLGTDTATEVNRDRSAASGRPIRGHARSGSLQIVPGRPNSYPGTVTGDDMLPQLTQCSQFTRPSFSDTPLPTRHGSIITTCHPGRLERLRLSGANWEETPWNHYYTEHTPYTYYTKGFQFLFTNLQISSCASVRTWDLARTAECAWWTTSANEPTTTTFSTSAERKPTNTNKPHARLAVTSSSYNIWV
jgi:hypothetical protein